MCRSSVTQMFDWILKSNYQSFNYEEGFKNSLLHSYLIESISRIQRSTWRVEPSQNS